MNSQARGCDANNEANQNEKQADKHKRGSLTVAIRVERDGDGYGARSNIDRDGKKLRGGRCVP